METEHGSTPTKKGVSVRLLVYGGAALLILGVIFLLYQVAKHYGIVGTSEADKLNAANDAENTSEAIALGKSTALKISNINDFASNGLGVAEMTNQYPFTPDQETGMVQQIYGDKTTFTHGNGSGTIAVIEQLHSKFQVSMLALAFSTAYGQDMYSFWKSNINDAGLAAIYSAINGMPDFVPVLSASQGLLNKYNETLTLGNPPQTS